ncbi:TPA: hypothetical protein SMR47_001440 [Pseudomonas putida]|nr:hypothetical protein [Pseudomonas putida]
MVAFTHSGTTYVDAQRVGEHLELLEATGFISYYHSLSPIPEEFPRRLLSVYADHLAALVEDGSELLVYEHDVPCGNYFMICRLNDHSLTVGRAHLQAKSDKDADDWGVPRNWPTR